MIEWHKCRIMKIYLWIKNLTKDPVKFFLIFIVMALTAAGIQHLTEEHRKERRAEMKNIKIEDKIDGIKAEHGIKAIRE